MTNELSWAKAKIRSLLGLTGHHRTTVTYLIEHLFNINQFLTTFSFQLSNLAMTLMIKWPMDFMEIDETISNASCVDLMETDSEYDNDYSSENSCDRDFVDDDDIQSEQDVSFYRRLDKSL